MGKDNENKTHETEKKHYILLQYNNSVSYTEKNVYLNDKKLKKEDNETTRSPKDIAEEEKNKFYNTFLKKHFKNIVVLTAAGTSLDNGSKSGKTRDGLWVECQEEIDAFESEIKGFKDKPFYINKDIEDLLSYIILFGKLNTDKRDQINKLQKALENKIKEKCTLELDSVAPHKDFLNKITARKNNDTRVQLFTTNYDTLFEQAANCAGFVIIDGFSFTQPREFSGKWFDLDIVNREKTRLKQEESFISKVFHLYKLHGSVNWGKNKQGQIIQGNNVDDPLIIYPASEKYESSYEQPYFEMMSRFQQSLRKEETLLIVIGFGFKDKHIQNAIIEAVEQNPSFQLLIVNYNNTGGIDDTALKDFFNSKENMQVKRNVNIVFDKFTDFTINFPENQTYYSKDNVNETI